MHTIYAVYASVYGACLASGSGVVHWYMTGTFNRYGYQFELFH